MPPNVIHTLVKPELELKMAFMAEEGEQALAALHFPVHDSDEMVVIPLQQMPDDPEEVLELLNSEALPPPKWFEVAQAYLSQGKHAQFVAILKEATDKEVLEQMETFFKRSFTPEVIQFHCAYAAYHSELAREERDPTKRPDLQNKANQSIAQAKQLDSNEALPYLAAGQFALAKGDIASAMLEFRQAANCKHNGKRNIAGLLAQAAVLYGQAKYTEALELYGKALNECPNAPAEVRLGVAACCYKLGNVERAQLAYERVLALDPSNADAMVGLATIKFGSSNVQQGLADGLKLLTRAFVADPSHPSVLTALSHFSLLREDFSRALALARAAFASAEGDAQRARALTLMARAYHAVGQLREAQQAYQQASRLNPKAPLPHLGSAQMELLSGEVKNAVSQLQAVLTEVPACRDALKLLGALNSVEPVRVGQSLQHFKDAVARAPDDAEMQELLGELLSTSNLAGALTAYKEALRLHREQQASATAKHSASANGVNGVHETQHLVPAKLLNNAAVLFYRAGLLSEAMDLMQEATSNMMRNDGDSGVGALQKVTMGYNMARLQEATGDMNAARAGYMALLEQFPGYIDCHLRLATLAHRIGAADEAVEWAQKAADAEKSSSGSHGSGWLDAQALLATLYLERKDMERAKECLNVIKAENKDDPFGKLAMASYKLAKMPVGIEARARPSDTPEMVQKRQDAVTNSLNEARMHYRDALSSQNNNLYAANGVGVVLAESGLLDAARDVFVIVQEAAASSAGFLKLPDVTINLAHVHLAKEAYESAITLYRKASRHYYNKNATVLLYLARALYDADDLLGARRTLLRAIHLAPTDSTLRFNAGLTMQEWAVRVYKRKDRPPNDPTKLPEYQEAAEQLRQASRTFEHLLRLGKETTRIEPRKLQVHVEFCNNTLAKAQELIRQADREAVQMALMAELQEKQLAAAEAARRQQDLQKQLARDRTKQESEAKAQKAMEDLQSKLAQWQQMPLESDSGKGRKGGGKGKGRKGADDGFIEYEQEEEAPSPARREDEQELLRRTGLESSDDEQAGTAKDMEAELFGADSDDDSGAAVRAAAKRSRSDADEGTSGGSGGKGRLKRRAVEEEEQAGGNVADDGDLFAEEEGAPGNVDMEDADLAGAEQGGASARQRQRAALEDSDEDAGDDEAAGAATGNGTAAAAEAWDQQQQHQIQQLGQEQQAGGIGVEEAEEDEEAIDLLLPQTADTAGNMHDLFGDDDD